MPRRCVVPNCLSNSRNHYKRTKEPYVSTFHFPTNEEKLAVWLKLINTACNSDIKEVAKCSGICIKHFEDHFILTEATATRPDGTVLTVPFKRPRLSANAVPTIFVEEKDFLNTPAGKRKFVKRVPTIEEKNIEEKPPEAKKNRPPVIKVVPLSILKNKPSRPNPVRVSGTYIIRAEVIKPGPKLILDECVSRIEKNAENQEQETGNEDLEEDEEDADDVDTETNVDA